MTLTEEMTRADRRGDIGLVLPGPENGGEAVPNASGSGPGGPDHVRAGGADRLARAWRNLGCT
jgi:hypothetical protein